MTSIEAGPTWSDRFNPRNWTLAWKLVVVGLVPALLALVLGVLRVADQAGEAADLGRSTRLLEVQEQVAGAADALRQERDEATLYVAGNRAGDRGVLEIGFGQADGEIDEMLSAVGGTSELDPTTRSALQLAENGLSQLAALRTDATGNPAAGPEQIRGRYTDIVEGVDVLDRALLRQLRTPGVSGLADALTAVTSATEQLAVQHTVLAAAIRAGRLQPGDATAVSATDNQLAADFREYQVALTPDQLARFGSFLDDAANSQRQRLEAAILAAAPDQRITLAPYEWDTAYNGSRAAADRSAALLRGELVTASTEAEEQASNLAGVNSVILMLGLLAGITIAVLVARSLIRSLRVLRTSALDVAERRLPQAVESMRAGESPDVTVDPVPLSGRDEVGQVARAFDAVHGQAVRLAADQAALQSNVSAMFVNLSRRSQALVERQLQLIEQLESNEQDPDQLSNLFQLDHLATRMRRNSENLLVLAGTDLAKRNVAPVPMVDVLRAAVSEVEQYQRIVVQAPPTATVVGRAASDLVHLLAELLDNATNFSPPDSQVVMSTTRTADGSIVVEIADRGVGMVDHELSDANQRLGGPLSVDVSASRRMGLFVVGRLGARHGIGVQLSTSSSAPGAGLTASVTVPAYLIPSSEPSDAGRPVGAGQRSGAAGSSQRAGINGSSRSGSLSALVAGTDGTANPAGTLEGPGRNGSDGGLFGMPPAANGIPNSLPTRRPGSTLRPDGPPRPPGQPDPAEQAASDQAGAERAAEENAREIAEQARRDQEAARRAAAQREADERRTGDRGPAAFRAMPFAPEQDPSRQNGSHRNGANPDPARIDTHRTDDPAANRPTPFAAGPFPSGRFAPGGPPAATGPADGSGSETREHQVVEPVDRQQWSAPGAESGPDQHRDEHAPEPVRGDAPGAGPVQDAGPEDAAHHAGTAPDERADDRADDDRAPAGYDGRTTGDTARGASGHEVFGGRSFDDASPDASLDAAPGDVSLDDGAFGDGAPPERPGSPVPPSPPTTPMPVVGRLGGVVPQRPLTARPEPGAPQPGPRQAPQPQTAGPRQYPQPAPRPQPSAPAQPVHSPEPVSAQQQDGLFAPSVPVIAEPETVAGGRGASADADPAGGFSPGETTPIFEEIASAWFRSNRAVPVEYGTEQAEAPRPPSPSPRPSPSPVRSAPALGAVQALQPAPAGEERVGAASGPVSDQGFASQADEGWRAASGAIADRPDEVTTAGLPKRRPRARLVPGSAGSAVLAAPVSPVRSAENIRGRLASYQQGVRQGRESRARGATSSAFEANGGTEPANTGGNHDEESS